MIDTPTRRRRAEAAEYLRQRWGMLVGSATLANYAVSGEGPFYCLIGKYAFYDDADLDSWAQSRITAPRRKASGDGVAPRDAECANAADGLRVRDARESASDAPAPRAA